MDSERVATESAALVEQQRLSAEAETATVAKAKVEEEDNSCQGEDDNLKSWFLWDCNVSECAIDKIMGICEDEMLYSVSDVEILFNDQSLPSSFPAVLEAQIGNYFAQSKTRKAEQTFPLTSSAISGACENLDNPEPSGVHSRMLQCKFQVNVEDDMAMGACLHLQLNLCAQSEHNAQSLFKLYGIPMDTKVMIIAEFHGQAQLTKFELIEMCSSLALAIRCSSDSIADNGGNTSLLRAMQTWAFLPMPSTTGETVLGIVMPVQAHGFVQFEELCKQFADNPATFARCELSVCTRKKLVDLLHATSILEFITLILESCIAALKAECSSGRLVQLLMIFVPALRSRPSVALAVSNLIGRANFDVKCHSLFAASMYISAAGAAVLLSGLWLVHVLQLFKFLTILFIFLSGIIFLSPALQRSSQLLCWCCLMLMRLNLHCCGCWFRNHSGRAGGAENENGRGSTIYSKMGMIYSSRSFTSSGAVRCLHDQLTNGLQGVKSIRVVTKRVCLAAQGESIDIFPILKAHPNNPGSASTASSSV
jgi:hypothetical protein